VILSLFVSDGPNSKTTLPIYCGVQRCLGGEGKDSKIQSFSLFLIEFSFILLYVDKNLSLKFYRMYRLI